MTTTTPDEDLLPVEHLVAITSEVWQSFLAQELVQDHADAGRTAVAGAAMNGCVQISGDWSGSVVLQTSLASATAAAEVMFMAEPGSLTDDEVADGLGELTNMVGGNIKSLLPGTCSLSLPSVTEGDSCTVRIPGAVLIHRVPLLGSGGPVIVSVWRA